MARKTLRELIRNVFSGKKGGSKKSAPKPRQNRDSRSEVVSSNAYTSPRRAMLNALRGKEEEKPKYKSMAEATSNTSSLAKLDSALKKGVPDPKQNARLKSQERTRQTLESIKKDRAELNAATNNRYNTKQSDKKEAQLARQRVKSGDMAADIDVIKTEYEQHPVATMAGRKLSSGASFGLIDLAEKKLAKGERKEIYDLNEKIAEEHPWVAGGAELAGGLIGFGMTAGATEGLGAKVMGKAAPKAAERLAETKAVQGLARRGVNKAVKKGLVSEATEELIKQTGKEKAAKIVSALGNDIVQNLTTGAVYDLATASKDYEIGSAGWWKSLGMSAALNSVITGGIAGGSILGGNKKAAVEAAKKLAKVDAPNVKVSLGRKRRTDLVLPNERPLQASADAGDIKLTPKNAEAKVNVPETVDNVKSKYPVVDATNGKGGTKWVVEVRDGNKVKRVTVIAPSENKAFHAISDANYGSDVKVIGKGEKVAGKNVDVAASTNRLDEVNAELEDIHRAINDPNTSTAEKELLDKQSRPLYKEKNSLEADIREAEAPAKGTKPAAENLKAMDDVAEDIPFTTDDGTPITGLRQELDDRARQLGEQPGEWSRAKTTDQLVDEPLRVNKVADETYMPGPTEGVAQSKSAYEYATGEEYVGTDVRTSWDEAWKADREYQRSHSYGNRRAHSKTSVTQIQAATSDEQRRLLQEAVKRGDIDYNRIHNEEMIHKAAENFHSDPDRYIKDLIDFNNGNKTLSYKDTPEWSAMAHYIMAVIEPSADQSSEIAFTEAFKLASDIASKAGQAQNLRRHFVHLTPAGRRDAIMDELASMLYNSRGFNNLHPDMPKDKYDALHYIRAYLEEDPIIEEKVRKLVEAGNKEFRLSQAADIAEEGAEGLAKNIGEAAENYAQVEGSMPGIDDVDVAHLELIEALNAHRPKTGFDVLQQMRYMFMLLNPRTHLRNIGGSFLFAPMRQISNGFRSLIEKPLANSFDVDIARHGGPSVTAAFEARVKNPSSEAGKKAAAALEKRGKDFLGGLKYETEMYKGRAKTIPGKALDWLSDKNAWVLTKEDDHFKKIAFKENYIKSYNKYLKDGVPITPSIKKRIEEEAIQEAYIATFNEANDAAKALNRLTRQANDPHASIGARWGARYVNAMMPFEKVPANITKQAINYSPLGLMRGAVDIAKAGRAGDGVALNKAIDELASGLTGTGVFLLGAWLQRRYGMFTTNTGKNDPGAKFKKDRGMQNYSINFIDPETGKGTSITLDWLVPTSSVFFTGVEFANQMSKGDVDLLALGGDWATVASRLAEPVLESSMLSGVHGALETLRGGYGDDDTKGAIDILIREAAQSYLNSLVPTALGQAARAFVYDSELQLPNEENDWKYFKNQIKSKAGLGNTNILGEPLGADTDAYGNIKGEHHGAAENLKYFAKVGLSPANIQKIDMSQVDQEKLRIYDEAVKNGADPNDMAYLFPKKQTKKQFSVGGEDVNMSNKEVSLYNQAKTNGGAEGMRYILDNSIIYNRYDYDAKGKKIPAESAYTAEQKEDLIKQFEGKSMREVEEWLYKDPMFQQASPAEQRKVIKNLWDLSKDTNTVASQRIGEQAVYKAQGKDVNEYNYKNEVTESKREKLDPYIESGLLTYEDIVDFERNGGKASFTENDEGGSVTTYYSKASMIDYFVEHGIPYDKAEALYNAYKNKNAKPYSGNSLSSGRSGRGGYRKSGGSRKAKVPKINAKSMAAATRSAKGTKVKLEPPKPKTTKVTTKFKKYEV